MTETLDTEVVSQLIAGDTHELKPVTIASGAGALSRGTVLGMLTADFTFDQFDQDDATYGLNTARSILAEDVDATSSAVVAQAYVLGKFRSEDLIWPSDITNAEKQAALLNLQDRGIVVDTDWA
ncbi:hypothetical protein DSCO28_07420 [Desulfosarcina ovata subsp. sediminis]|uniref:Head decoration protein n=1 Tax=Desulfosarcina ovata subsp. sediminis TaxID=885957 RepID=A0A5K7ZGS1_9BACT|nr:head decoration protein [Desulfosarcina ovata]BBO80176.1 hypothetical protein DSCO28_07420 [Desulfosarcina ovata subsp. sediminis]